MLQHPHPWPQNLHRTLHLASFFHSKAIQTLQGDLRPHLRGASVRHWPGKRMMVSQAFAHPKQAQCLKLHLSISSLSALNSGTSYKISPMCPDSLWKPTGVFIQEGKMSEVSNMLRGRESSSCQMYLSVTFAVPEGYWLTLVCLFCVLNLNATSLHTDLRFLLFKAWRFVSASLLSTTLFLD